MKTYPFTSTDFCIGKSFYYMNVTTIQLVRELQAQSIIYCHIRVFLNKLKKIRVLQASARLMIKRAKLNIIIDNAARTIQNVVRNYKFSWHKKKQMDENQVDVVDKLKYTIKMLEKKIKEQDDWIFRATSLIRAHHLTSTHSILAKNQ